MATTKRKYWRMGVRYIGASGIEWGTKRFPTVSELLKAVEKWSEQNEDALAQLIMRCDYEYFTAKDQSVEASNPAQ